MALSFKQYRNRLSATIFGAGVFVVLASIATLLIYATLNREADAASTQNFDPGMLVSQANFTNNNSMSASEIQAFLNKRNSSCLANYKGLALIDANKNGQIEDWTTAERYGGATGKQQMTAAQLIKAAADTYGINPQVFLVTLEKEQGLVTRKDCPQWRYNTAFGFGCPDTAPCDTAAYGFTRQLDNAAYHFKNYMTGKDVFGNIVYSTFKPGTRSVRFNPKESCGSSSVNIANAATAALYTYTPYQPNKAALDAGYGTGNNCSAYGNRNFHLFYSDWFGSPHNQQLKVGPLDSSFQPVVEESTNASITITNYRTSTMRLGRLKFEAINNADSSVQYHFTSANDVTISPGKSYTYKASTLIGKEGSYTLRLVRHNGSKWLVPPFTDHGVTQSIEKTFIVTKRPTISQSLTIPKTLHQNEVTDAKFSIKNNSSIYAVDIGRTKVEGKHSDGTQYDLPSTPNNLVLQPNASYNYSEQASLPKKGTYTFKLMNFRSDFGWTGGFPASQSSSIIRSSSVQVIDPATVISQLSLSSQTPRTGENITATFSIKNHSTKPVNIGRTKVEGKHSDGTQYDFGSTPDNLILQPNETYNYSSTRSLPKTGSYTFKLMNFREKERWSSSFPVSENSTIKRSVGLSVKDVATLSSSLQISNTSPRTGDPITAKFTIHNYGSEFVNVGRTKVEGRHSDGTQYDFESTPDNLTLAPGQTYSYTSTRSLPKSGSYTFKLMNFREKERWSSSFPASENTNITRSIAASVKDPATITSSLDLSKTSARTGENITATFSIKNHSTKPVNIGRTKVEGKHSDGTQYDFGSTPDNLILQPNETYNYSSTRSLPKTGSYTFKLMNFREKERWSSSFPLSESSAVKRSVSLRVL